MANWIHVHETNPLELELHAEAARISARLGDAPVVIVVGGDKDANIPRTLTVSAAKSPLRLRDLLGILQAAIQTESWKHFRNW
jgi:hypothetical protein